MSTLGTDTLSLPIRNLSRSTGQRAQNNLLDLNEDVLNCIFSFVNNNNDMPYLLRVNRKCHSLGLFHLYNHLRLDISLDLMFESSERYDSLLSKHNPGLPYVRVVKILGCPNFGKSPVEDQDIAARLYDRLSNLIYILPKDQLTDFQWFAHFPMPILETLDLWRRQKGLKSIMFSLPGLFPWVTSPLIPGEVRKRERRERDNLYSSEGPSTLTSSLNHLERVSALNSIVHDKHTLQLVCQILAHHRITDLQLDLRNYRLDFDPNNPETMHFSDPSRVLHSLEIQSPSSLRRLSLFDVELSKYQSSWGRLFELTNVEHLSLSYCFRADLLLWDIVSNDVSKLKEIELVHSEAPYLPVNKSTPGALNKLLHGLPQNQLKALYVSLRGVKEKDGSLPKMDYLSRQCQSLKLLYINVRSGDGIVEPSDPEDDPGLIDEFHAYDSVSLAKFLKSCTRLEHLGIPFPSFQIRGQRFHADLSARVSNAEHRETFSNREFTDLFDAVILNLRLSLLNILNYPAPWFNPYVSEKVGIDDDYDYCMADLLYEHISDLRRQHGDSAGITWPILAFGASDPYAPSETFVYRAKIPDDARDPFERIAENHLFGKEMWNDEPSVRLLRGLSFEFDQNQRQSKWAWLFHGFPPS
ncbi:hypothetical protein M501DRAFT_1028448 [Patellaria atrata CBS 101060]|uniref:F-box domain-containing protein n=1 Tax=Patellaria atrata CBS 101060 TaxID=1346257 RepID=A0A9P4VW33_9PEZI|nr:hypothetical protein M501DRAFT_1028448 [Patellaria atrata CBS 101060]